MYPDADIAHLITHHFIPIRVHAKNDADAFQKLGGRFDAQWTPTTLIVDPPDIERHRIEGFLPKEDFRSQLELGLAKAAFGRGDFADAERRFEEVLERFPGTDAAPEAQYWAGVARYKAKGDANALAETARAFTTRYTDSAWAKKASVWRAA